MYTEEDVASAIAAGVLTEKTAAAFRAHVAKLKNGPAVDEEFFALLGVFDGQTTLGQAIAVIALYVSVAIISLCIDRRALMLSALIYVLYTFSALLEQYGVVSFGFAITALVIGSALLLLSAFWHPSRMFILGLFPLSLQSRLAPVR